MCVKIIIITTTCNFKQHVQDSDIEATLDRDCCCPGQISFP